MLKKHISLALCGIGAVAMLSGCYTGGPVPVKNSTPTAAEGDIKTGLAVVIDLSGSAAPSDGKDGAGKTVFTAAAVLVDSQGTILSCDLDTLEASVNFSAEGKITSDLTLPFQTKGEKGDNYNMKGASPIQKEWYEQAEAFCNYVVGKTAEEVSGIPLDEGGKTTDADLAAGCTISIPSFVQAVVEATENATARGAAEGDAISIGISASAADSKDAGDEDGAVELAATFVAVSMEEGGIFTSGYADSVETTVNFTATGEITTDLTAPVVSKYDKKESYNMKSISPIQKEWYEQADGFCNFLRGRTMTQVSDAMYNGSATPADLAATCTINTNGLMDATSKAAARMSE